MKARLLHHEASVRTFLLVFEPGDEFLAPLLEFARRENVQNARFSAIGALAGATLAWFNPESKQYEPFTIDEQVECASLIGNITVKNAKPFVHAHCVLGKRDGSCVGGHIKNLKVLPTLEMTLVQFPGKIARKFAESGFLLIDPEA